MEKAKDQKQIWRKYVNNQLKSNKDKLQLTLDTNIQFLIREELMKSQKIFKTYGSAAILMDINNGEIISLVSLPDFDLNKRQEIKDIYAYLKIIFNKYDIESAFRIVTRPSRGIGTKTLEKIKEKQRNSVQKHLRKFRSLKYIS